MSTCPSDGHELFFGERPVSKARPRKGKGRFYTPRRTKDWEKALAWAWAERYGGEILYPREQILAVQGSFHFHDRRCGDVDNLSKSLLDSLNGLAWEDDSQVMVLHSCKRLNLNHTGVGIWVLDSKADPCALCKAMCRRILEECPWGG